MSLLPELVSKVSTSYPGFRVRVYHNVTDPAAGRALCQRHCAHAHLDLCDVSEVPTKLGRINALHFGQRDKVVNPLQV